jgi:hypothetical protein
VKLRRVLPWAAGAVLLATVAPTPPSGQNEPPECDPSYPTICIPAGASDLDCGDIRHARFPVREPDRHGFDADHDGIGCEWGAHGREP